jgi:hypothetical protein
MMEAVDPAMNSLHPSAESSPRNERRGTSRFPISEDISYKVYGSRNSIETGTGKTINVSSRGVLFTTEKPLHTGKRLEIAMNWPAALNEKCALKLVASGRVVRVEDGRAAVQIDKYEFRTRGRDANKLMDQRLRPS